MLNGIAEIAVMRSINAIEVKYILLGICLNFELLEITINTSKFPTTLTNKKIPSMQKKKILTNSIFRRFKFSKYFEIVGK